MKEDHFVGALQGPSGSIPQPATGTGTQQPSPFIAILMSPVNSVFRIHLDPGKYAIGRSTVPVDDPFFINLESPRSAVSRNHAALVISRNGDAWLLDNESTNGTFLAIREGEGIRLEPKHFYQLTSGALIIFGDTEIRFVLEPRSMEGSVLSARAKSVGSQRTASQPAPKHDQHSNDSAAQLDRTGMLAKLAKLADYSSETSAAAQRSRIGASTPPSQCDQAPQPAPAVPSAAVSRTASTASMPVVKAEPRKSKENSSAKRRADEGAAEDAHPPPPPRRLRRDDARTFRTFGSNVQACLTGFDSRARIKYTKAIVNAGGSVDDEWSDDCNLLVVQASPTSRTPKVIMAVAQGRDIVTPAFVDKGELSAEDACAGVDVGNGAVIPATTIRAAIWRYRDLGPPLKGRSFYVVEVEPKAARDQLIAILKSCGATIAKSKSKSATVLSGEDVDGFYNSILRGDGVSK